VWIGEKDDDFLLRSMRQHSIERKSNWQQISSENDRRNGIA